MRRSPRLWSWAKHHVVLITGIIVGACMSCFVTLKVHAKHVFRKTKKPALHVPMQDSKLASISKARFREKTAWTLLGTLTLTLVIHSLGLDQRATDYYETSILNARAKNAVVREAKKLLNKGYRLGEAGPDYFDCSGYTITVLKNALGLDNLPRSSNDIYLSVGRPIAKSDLGVGDLVFFDTFNYGRVSHVGIVIDTEGHFANANSYLGKTTIDDLNAQYWRNTWIGARELTEYDGIDESDREKVKLAREDELTETVYDEIGFPPSELADPRLNTDTFAAAEEIVVAEPAVVLSDDEAVDETDHIETVTNNEQDELPIEEDSEIKSDVTDDEVVVEDTESEVVVEREQLFTDIPVDDPLYEATALLRELGVISGYDDGSFRPDRTVSRIELLKMAFKTFDIAPDVFESGFLDMPATHWGQGYVSTAVSRGIVSGYDDNLFRPDQTVNRVEALKILFNAGGLPLYIYEDGLFDDVRASDWFAPYIQSAVTRELVDVTGSQFEPDRGMKRRDVAEFIYRLLRPYT